MVFRLILVMVISAGIVMISGCGAEQKDNQVKTEPRQEIKLQQERKSDTGILDSWSGNYPTNKISLLPDDQQQSRLGYITDQVTFTKIWKEFRPDNPVPQVDFDNNMVVFMRNTKYFNIIRIAKVQVQDGVMEIFAAETMSAMPITTKAAMSMIVVSREGVKAIKSRDMLISIN